MLAPQQVRQLGDIGRNPPRPLAAGKGRKVMAWTTPVLVEICIGLEINGYMPADGYVPPEF